MRYTTRVEIKVSRKEPILLAKCLGCDKEWTNAQTASTYAKLHTIETGHKTSIERINTTNYEVAK
jgi:hypothetical protein